MTAPANQWRPHRTIRSFVRRSGRMTPAQQKALDERWPDYGLEFEAQLLDFNKAFNRDAPVVIEIGFGNGETLLQQAQDNPEYDYLGIEVHEPGVGHCLLRACDAAVTNLRLIAHDAIEVLDMQVPSGALSRINLYFPDPWPKKRHHKRRIVQSPFLALCGDRLEPGGALHVATDWANYADHIDAVLGKSEHFTCTERREHTGDRPLDRPMTKFERRGLRKGHKIYDWRFERM